MLFTGRVKSLLLQTTRGTQRPNVSKTSGVLSQLVFALEACFVNLGLPFMKTMYVCMYVCMYVGSLCYDFSVVKCSIR